MDASAAPVGGMTAAFTTNPITVGDSVRVTGSVLDDGANPTPAGTVSFAIDGNGANPLNPPDVPLDGSGAYLSAPISGLSVGNHSVAVHFTPNDGIL